MYSKQWSFHHLHVVPITSCSLKDAEAEAWHEGGGGTAERRNPQQRNFEGCVKGEHFRWARQPKVNYTNKMGLPRATNRYRWSYFPKTFQIMALYMSNLGLFHPYFSGVMGPFPFHWGRGPSWKNRVNYSRDVDGKKTSFPHKKRDVP